MSTIDFKECLATVSTGRGYTIKFPIQELIGHISRGMTPNHYDCEPNSAAQFVNILELFLDANIENCLKATARDMLKHARLYNVDLLKKRSSELPVRKLPNGVMSPIMAAKFAR